MSATARKGSAAPAPSPDHALVGDRVIELRSAGKSFASIAESVGMKRSLDAFAAFVAGLATRPPDEQAKLRAEEHKRLDTLEQRIQKRPDGADRDRKIASVRKLRQRLSPS